MSLSEDLLTILFSYSGGYHLLRAKMLGRSYPKIGTHTQDDYKFSDATARVTLSRLKKKGFVENKNGIWKITSKGREYLSKIRSYPEHSQISKEKKQKRMIIAFDIPERYKYKRHWLRIELVCLGFTMLQKSVWLGPAPLPQQFVNGLHELKILPYLKFFQAKEADVV